MNGSEICHHNFDPPWRGKFRIKFEGARLDRFCAVTVFYIPFVFIAYTNAFLKYDRLSDAIGIKDSRYYIKRLTTSIKINRRY